MDADCVDIKKALDNVWDGVFMQFSWVFSTDGSFW
jgi:hypothetical protein